MKKGIMESILGIGILLSSSTSEVNAWTNHHSSHRSHSSRHYTGHSLGHHSFGHSHHYRHSTPFIRTFRLNPYISYGSFGGPSYYGSFGPFQNGTLNYRTYSPAPISIQGPKSGSPTFRIQRH